MKESKYVVLAILDSLQRPGWLWSLFLCLPLECWDYKLESSCLDMCFIPNKLNIHNKLWKDYKGKAIFTCLQPIQSLCCHFNSFREELRKDFPESICYWAALGHSDASQSIFFRIPQITRSSRCCLRQLHIQSSASNKGILPIMVKLRASLMASTVYR